MKLTFKRNISLLTFSIGVVSTLVIIFGRIPIIAY